MASTKNCTTLRLLHYPSISEDLIIKPGQIRCGEHTDYGSITLLFQDDMPGLEVNINFFFLFVSSRVKLLNQDCFSRDLTCQQLLLVTKVALNTLGYQDCFSRDVMCQFLLLVTKVLQILWLGYHPKTLWLLFQRFSKGIWNPMKIFKDHPTTSKRNWRSTLQMGSLQSSSERLTGLAENMIYWQQ